MQLLSGNQQMTVSTIVSGAIGLLYVYVPDGVTSLTVSGIAQRSVVSMTTITLELQTRPGDGASSPVAEDSVVFDIDGALATGDELTPLSISLTPSAPGMYRFTALANAGAGSISCLQIHGE